MAATPHTSVVIPCYNEAERINPAEVAVLAQCVDLVVLVDDGSTDTTLAILHDLASRSDGTVEVVEQSTNQGKAAAVRAGLVHSLDAGAEIVGFLDADGATPAYEFERLLDVLLSSPDVDVVLASRVARLGASIERRPVRHYRGRAWATIASAALDLDVYDTQCGCKLFRRTEPLADALTSEFSDPWAFDVELLGRLIAPLTSSVRGLDPERFLEVPLIAWRDVGGSKVTTADGVRAGFALVRTWRDIARRRARHTDSLR